MWWERTLAKNEEVNLRVAVGSRNGPRSSIWRAFSTKSEVYVCHSGLGGIEKFSFHSSGICRRAFTKEEGPGDGEDDRVIQKWKRLLASTNSDLIYALAARFPTDYLSTALAPEKKKVLWVPPASAGKSTQWDFIFTQMEIPALEKLGQANGRMLISYTRLPNGEAFAVSWVHTDWIGGKDFTVPGALYDDKEFVISTDDPDRTGRPARLTMYQGLTSEQPIMLATEYGAYAMPLGTKFSKPMGKLTRTKVLKRNKGNLPGRSQS